eukprot:Blabericola_migrator_1__4137@NODE_2262_length_3039_cov_131_909152_g1424_i0_p3_GENE_NODE_2262_length_3039_cov_131_909152_g1424_i0NODE_2262_length_3039_cov_131_909152_g1424_i0_p3_ORF_typecomplete_len138_score39_39Ribosomal_L24e/PF01246_20/1_1e20Ribosomal_L24e/PF01246_20/4_9e03_NODE_2262_length_3039_cov_131_909152_g1424_i080493
MSSRGPQATTTMKLETCAYTEMRIYPGRGIMFVSKDGKTHILSSHKAASLYHQHIKPVKLTWTQAWRRANKKAVALTGTGKKRTTRTTKVQKAIVGLSLDELQKKRAAAEAARKSNPQPEKSAAHTKKAPKKPAQKA